VPKRRVCADWRAPLPATHQELYEHTVTRFEAAYNMLSVALNQAFHLRARGSLVPAREGAAMAADLCDRLAAHLRAALLVLEQQGRHLGALPDVLPCDAGHFRGAHARRVADWSRLLDRVLFSARTRYFYKVSTLDDLLAGLAREFRAATEEIAEGATVHPERGWAALDALHFDLNTCLREMIVMLKSFLVRLPEEQVALFARRLAEAAESAQATPAPRRRPVLSQTRR
jgi:hypothetical protein